MHHAQPLDLRLWARIVPAFAIGYFLSYGLRTVNAVIAPELTRELGLAPADLGLLTSAYFLAFGLFQLPLGLLLDRFGPRRVEAVLLLVAALGCAVFALGDGLASLTAGRALIGLGVSACLMASFKCFHQWFPADRQASLTGTIMVAGGLGALTASVPVAAALPLLGWRGVFFALAALAVLVAIVLMLSVPEHDSGEPPAPLAVQLRGVADIFASRAFWRFAPQATFNIGGFMAVQGLWAVPWLMSVEGASRGAAAEHLLWMGSAMLVGFLIIAVGAGWLARHGLKPMVLLTAGIGIGVGGFAAIVFQWLPGWAAWPLLGLSFSMANLSYPMLASHFPPALAGRANTALTLVVFIGAFGLQWGLGALVSALTAAGRTEAEALRVAFAGLLLIQLLAWLWLFASGRRPAVQAGAPA